MKNFCIVLCIALFSVEKTFAAEAGMPQLNPEFWAAQMFWLIIIFSGLYLIIWKIFLPKITYSIENRKTRVVNDLDEAQKLKERAEKKLGEYNKIIDEAKKEAKKIIETNKKKLDEEIEKKKKSFNEEIEKELSLAEKEIINLKKSSIASIGKIAEETSTEVIKQIIDTDVNKSNVCAIVNDIIKKKVDKHI